MQIIAGDPLAAFLKKTVTTKEHYRYLVDSEGNILDSQYVPKVQTVNGVVQYDY